MTQGDPFSVVLYRITIFPLAEELWSYDPGLLTPFYTDNVVFGRLVRRGTQLLKLLMDRGPYQGYFSDPAKALFIADFPEQEEAVKRVF